VVLAFIANPYDTLLRDVAPCRLCEHAAMQTTQPTIIANPDRRGGRACVRDLRISVGDVLGWLAQGMSSEQIVAEYPELTVADIRACLAYAAQRESELT
jgi:uncharacterized protein (DUF433 family)